MFLFLLYSCFLLFILWGSVLKKIIMLANSYIHKKDISIVYVYHVNLVKLYTIYHRKMMLLFFFLCIHIKGLVFLLANMVNYWMCCWWLILLSHVIDMVTFVMVTKWCQRTRRPRIVGSMAQKGDCGRESQSKKSSSFSDDSLGIPNINKAKKYGLNEVIPVDVLDYSTFASSLDLLVYFILHHVNDYIFWYSSFVKENKIQNYLWLWAIKLNQAHFSSRSHLYKENI